MSVRKSLGLVAMTVALAACGGSGATAGSSQPAGGASSALPSDGAVAASPSGSDAGPVTGHLGDKLTFRNYATDPVDATLVKIFDPATPNKASEAPLPSATHWVGAEVIVDDQADHDTDSPGFDAITSAGSTVTTTLSSGGGSYVVGDGFTGCTHTDGIPQDVTPYTYCAAFPVPDGQTLVTVGINVTGAPLVKTDQATWTVPLRPANLARGR